MIKIRFSRLFYLLLMGVGAKLFIDTAGLIFHPFLAIFADGIGVDVVAMGRFVALSSLMGVTAPILGHLADRFGYRTVLRLCLFFTGAGLMLGAYFGRPAAMAAAMILIGLGFAGFAPTFHAYLSAQVSYEKRARGIATLEYSYALASILGLFMVGQLIEAYSWRAPLYCIGGALIGWSVVYLALPRTTQASSPHAVRKGRSAPKDLGPKLRTFFDLGDNRISAWANIVLTALHYFAIANIMIIHGTWLQRTYGLGPADLGRVALVIGLFDLGSCVAVAFLVDRMGKRRSVITGVAGSMIGYLLLPWLNFSLRSAVMGLILIRIFFEYATVSNFSLLSEQVPRQRGKIMGMSITFGYGGSALASLFGPAIFLKYGLWGICPISFGAAAVSLMLLVFAVRERYSVREI